MSAISAGGTWVCEDITVMPLATVDTMSTVRTRIKEAVSLDCNTDFMRVFNLTGNTGSCMYMAPEVFRGMVCPGWCLKLGVNSALLPLCH